MGNSEYKKAFDEVILPIANQYNPQIVLVSSGFDAREGDELGQYHISDTMFGHMTNQLRSLAHGKLILFMEGGYNPGNIAKSVSKCIVALLTDQKADCEDDISELGFHEISLSAWMTLKKLKSIQSKFWKL